MREKRSMVNVRPSLRNEILRELDNTPFGKDLFVVKIQEQETLVYIMYLSADQFNFTLKNLAEPVGSRYNFVTHEAPGLWMLEAEEFMHENFATARGRIQSWARRIEEDYRATEPDFQDLEGLRDEFIKEFGASDMPAGGESFTRREKQFGRKTQRAQQIMEKIFKDKDATQHQINIMNEQIKKLKNSIDVLNKRTWTLAAANRLINIFKEIRAAVGEVRAITKDFENLLPDLSRGSDDMDGKEER